LESLDRIGSNPSLLKIAVKTQGREYAKGRIQKAKFDGSRDAVHCARDNERKMFGFRWHMARDCFPLRGVLLQSPADPVKTLAQILKNPLLADSG
jgi:hypothetical protein